MDKVEYKIRADEIKALIGEGRYAEAVKIADTIDWKRVKSVAMLCTISDLYKINRRYEESRDVLLMAYDKHPTGRLIVQSLCELAIKMGEFVQAVEYYKEFVRISPRDPGRYILQYKLYEAQEVSLEERIAVLEELKKHDYRERWAYELAYLYHRVGLTTECVEECDEMFLWFGEGRYVMKALELKALHEPLSPEQQDRYNRYKNKTGVSVDIAAPASRQQADNVDTAMPVKQTTKEMPRITNDMLNAYNAGTPVAESVSQNTGSMDIPAADAGYSQNIPQDTVIYGEPVSENVSYIPQAQETITYQPVTEQRYEEPSTVSEDGINYPHINEIKEPSVDVSAYNTMNLQEALAEGLKEIYAEEQAPQNAPVQPAGNMQELFFDTQTQDIPTAPSMGIDIKYGGNGPILGEAKTYPQIEDLDEVDDSRDTQPGITIKEAEEPVREGAESASEESRAYQQTSMFGTRTYEEKPLEDEVPGAVIHPNATYKMPSHFERILSQESDGQISMAVEPEPEVEKQITGQISIAEYMENWEKYKKEQQEKQLQKVKQRVADETGDMFADYDEKTKAGLQERIEQAISEALKKEQYAKASGRGNWSVNKDDVINAAVEDVIDEAESKELPISDSDELDKIPDEIPEEIDADANAVEEALAASRNAVITATGTIEIAQKESAQKQEQDEEIEVAEPEETLEQSTEQQEETQETSDQSAEQQEEAADIAPSEDKPSEVKPITKEIPTDEVKAQTRKDRFFRKHDKHNKHAKNEEESRQAAVEQAEKEEAVKSKEEPKTEVKPSESDKDKKPKEAADKESSSKRHIGNREIEERVRTMTPEEKELFGPYIHHKKSRRQIINAIDNLSMDAFTGNAIVTGEEGAGTVNLAKGLIKAVQASDSNFSGKVAKITANTLNKKSTSGIFEKLANGALIIQRAADLNQETVSDLLKILQEENKGLIIVMEDTRDDMDKFLEKNPSLTQSFNVRVDIEALDDDSLVAYAKQYAYEKEYAIDNLGILALHTRISERQTLDHEVTVAEVKDIVDDAIYYAEKRSVAHFVDVIVNKRYDENDMVILREKDFMH